MKNLRITKFYGFLIALFMAFLFLPVPVKAEEEEYITSLDITYNAPEGFPSTMLTAEQVSNILYASITSTRREEADGSDWYIYGPSPTPWCGICYRTEEWNNDENNDYDYGYVWMGNSDLLDDEILPAGKDYYLIFNPCPDVKKFDPDTIPTVTVNGEPADEVRRNGEELVVYKKVELVNTASDYYTGLSISPAEGLVVKGGLCNLRLQRPMWEM